MIENAPNITTPYWLIDESRLRHNLNILDRVQKKSGAKILLAQKSFSAYSTYPLLSSVLKGTTSSSLHELKLAKDFFPGERHTYMPAYMDHEIDQIAQLSDHLVFNSISQWNRYSERVRSISPNTSLGLRINPEYAEIVPDIYNPCVRYSRLGIKVEDLKEFPVDSITGLHLHNHCSSQAKSLEKTISILIEKFEPFLKKISWLNFGGGHYMTEKNYDLDKLISLIQKVKKKYELEVYLEPGEAVAFKSGLLVTEVLDILHNEMPIAILSTSASTHISDILEMPYRPEIRGADKKGVYPHLYRLGGMTCLAGDILGDYSFPQKLNIGDRVILEDMAQYTMVKCTTFNGVPLPKIVVRRESGEVETIKSFGYEDYKNRLS